MKRIESFGAADEAAERPLEGSRVSSWDFIPGHGE
jgi:hypothetical protein